jgi:uncharacterized lipoprotein YajG
MKNYLKCMSVFIFSFSVIGCAATSEYITPNPAVQQNVNSVGHGKRVAVNVVDERTEQDVGLRASDYGVVRILLASNSMDAINDAASTALAARGFKPVNYDDYPHEATTLIITLTRLSDEVIPPVFGNAAAGSTLLNSTMQVRVVRAGSTYQQSYRADLNVNLPFADSKERDQKIVSQVLSKNINRIFFDRNLMAFLAK